MLVFNYMLFYVFNVFQNIKFKEVKLMEFVIKEVEVVSVREAANCMSCD